MDPEYCCKELMASSISVLLVVSESVSVSESRARLFKHTLAAL